jgi:hypothetical protein
MCVSLFFVLWAGEGDSTFYGVADLISGSCSVELMNIFTYIVISNIFFVRNQLLQTFQKRQNIRILFFLSILKNQKQITT